MSEASGQRAPHEMTQAYAPTSLSEQEVMEYLAATPDFFNRHPELVEKLQIPHEQKGSVSLVEMQRDQLRKKARRLGHKLNTLIEVAKQNEAIYRVYVDLNLRLFGCRYFSEVQDTLEDVMTQQLKLSAVTLKSFEGANALPEIQRKLFTEKRFKQASFFFGRLSQHEKQLLFADQPAESTALILLGEQGEMGILAVASKDPSHFNPDMDTLLLSQLQKFLNALLPNLAGY